MQDLRPADVVPAHEVDDTKCDDVEEDLDAEEDRGVPPVREEGEVDLR